MEADATPTLATRAGWRLYIDLVKLSGIAWVEDRAPSMGAALAFYSAFSLAPLLIIVIAVAGAVFGVEDARAAIVTQMTALVGATAAHAIEALLKAAHATTTTGVTATIVGVVTLLVGATTVLVEVQDDLDLIWKAPKRTGSGLLSMLRARILSLGMILAIGFLLLVSLVLSSAMAVFGVYSEAYFPRAALMLLHVSNFVFSVGVLTVLFAMLYKWLPNVAIGWRDVWMGAFTTAVLFSVGRIAIGLYLGRSAIASAYGAAGTLVVLLLWLDYSAQVFLLGAEFTSIRSRYRSQQAAARVSHVAAL